MTALCALSHGKLAPMDAGAYSDLPLWSQRLIAEVEDSNRRAELLARPLSREQLNWRTALNAWSIGQCLEHLIIGNMPYVGAISDSLDRRQQSPVQEVRLSRISKWFIHNYIGPEMGARAKAPKKIRPASSVDPSAVDEFLHTNQIVREVIVRASAYNVNAIRFKNPFIPLLRFTVGTGLEIVSQHEKRHLLQAERVRQSPGFPTNVAPTT